MFLKTILFFLIKVIIIYIIIVNISNIIFTINENSLKIFNMIIINIKEFYK